MPRSASITGSSGFREADAPPPPPTPPSSAASREPTAAAAASFTGGASSRAKCTMAATAGASRPASSSLRSARL